MAKHGLRNALLVAPMPTASTSQILGNSECFEPINSAIGTRRTLAGDFICVQKTLMRKLIALGLWSTELKDKIVAKSGSVQGIAEIPANIQAVYKTRWEVTITHRHAQRSLFLVLLLLRLLRLVPVSKGFRVRTFLPHVLVASSKC
jgi:ribonucleotide reductase alpha subunit